MSLNMWIMNCEQETYRSKNNCTYIHIVFGFRSFWFHYFFYSIFHHKLQPNFRVIFHSIFFSNIRYFLISNQAKSIDFSILFFHCRPHPKKMASEKTENPTEQWECESTFDFLFTQFFFTLFFHWQITIVHSPYFCLQLQMMFFFFIQFVTCDHSC